MLRISVVDGITYTNMCDACIELYSFKKIQITFPCFTMQVVEVYIGTSYMESLSKLTKHKMFFKMFKTSILISLPQITKSIHTPVKVKKKQPYRKMWYIISQNILCFCCASNVSCFSPCK